MKTRFPQKSNKRDLLAGTLVAAIFLLFFTHAFESLQTAGISLVKPALAIREDVTEKIKGTSKKLLSSKQELAEEVARLSAEVERMENSLAVLPELENELAFYREIHGREEAREMIVGKVISRPPFSPHDYLLLDAGLEQGIKKGALAESRSGALLGKIALVKRDHSFVMLFSSPDKKTSAILPGGEEVLLSGLGSGNFYLELPKDAPLKKNDRLLDPASGKPLAVVSTIITSESNPFMEIYLRSSADLNTLDRVLIAK